MSSSTSFIHLSKDHDHVRQHASHLHFPVEFLSLTTSLANAAEDAHAIVMPDHVVNHLREQHRLAHACTTEKAGLAAAFQGNEHVDHLNARLEHLRLG
jgi:hypothetical protein